MQGLTGVDGLEPTYSMQTYQEPAAERPGTLRNAIFGIPIDFNTYANNPRDLSHDKITSVSNLLCLQILLAKSIYIPCLGRVI